MAFTFTKEERLCSKIFIAKLFEKGNPRINGFPFRVSWLHEDLQGPFPAQVMFLVSKRQVAEATTRNRIKRQMRELYRHHKHELYEALNKKDIRLLISIAYLGNSAEPMSKLQPEFIKVFQKLIHELAKSH